MISILVTGSEGSLGPFLVEKIYQTFRSVCVIRVGRSRKLPPDGRSRYYWGDLADFQFIQQIFSENKISYVIHCAARWNGFNQDPVILYNNLFSTLNLLLSISPEVKKFIYLSSAGVYQDTAPIESTALTCPSSSYCISKLLGEKLVEQFSVIKGLPYTIYRPFHIVSPTEYFEQGRSHVCTDMCYRIIERKETIDYNDLDDSKKIGFTWVEDIADAIIDNIENKKTDNEIFNIGTSEKHTVKDLVYEILSEATKSGLVDAQFKSLARPAAAETGLDPCFSKIFQIYGGHAQTEFSECVKKYIECKYL
ncbi:MAG: NAD(P)-dependent oxidoreductase [Deltaproteobacteria bacterium]|nr:NAD(P)-dependent oxidoreductase [Deltaproteobacteria bacterium]